MELKLKEFTHKLQMLRKQLFRFAYRITGKSSDAEDIVQETYIRVWNKHQEGQEVNNLEAFCMRITKNLALDRVKSAHYRLTQELPQGHHHSPTTLTPYQHTSYQDLIQQIHQCVNTLPDKQQAIFQLREIEGLPYEEIAQKLDLPLNQIKVNLFRARKKIKTILEKYQSYGL